MKKYHHQILALTLVLILAGLFSGCGGWAGAPEETRAALPGTQEAIQSINLLTIMKLTII